MGRLRTDGFAGLQAQIDSLRVSYESIKDETEALREYLESVCILQREQFSAQMHRRRFAKVLEKFPCKCDATVAEVLRTADLMHLVLRGAGVHALGCFAAAASVFRHMPDLVPRKLYVLGGFDSAGVLGQVEAFDGRTGRWETLPPMPTPRSNLVACSLDGLIFAIGGSAGTQVLGSAEAFDPVQNVWMSLPPMPTPRSGTAAATHAGYVYIVGGREGFRSLGTAERFCLAHGRWEALPPMPSPRRFLAAAVLDGKLYAVGGEDDEFVALAAAERLDVTSLHWETVAPMPTRRRGLAAVALRSRLFAVGGRHVVQGQNSQAGCMLSEDLMAHRLCGPSIVVHPSRTESSPLI